MTVGSAAHLAKSIVDLDTLVELLMRELGSKTTWERSLSSELARAREQLQLLRMSVSMGRPDDEKKAVAVSIANCCAKARVSLSGSRVPRDTAAAVALAAKIARAVAEGFGQ